MVIKIETRKAGIPVQIGELEFTFDTSDAAVQLLLQRYEKVVEKIASIKDGGDEGTKKALQEGFDLILGDGSFEQIYAQTPSTIECLKYLYVLFDAINAELAAINPIASQQAKAQQYLQGKKKRKK